MTLNSSMVYIHLHDIPRNNFACSKKGKLVPIVAIGTRNCTNWDPLLHWLRPPAISIGPHVHLLEPLIALVRTPDCNCWDPKLHMLGSQTALVWTLSCTNSNLELHLLELPSSN